METRLPPSHRRSRTGARRRSPNTRRSAAFGAVLSAVLALAGTACRAQTPAGSAADRGGDGCISRFEEGRDYFPDKTTATDAKGFRVEYRKSYKVVTVNQPFQGAPPQRYVLVQCGAPTPALSGDLAGATAVTVPVKRVAAQSTTYLPAFDALGAVDRLVAVSELKRVSTPAVVDAGRAGRISEFGDPMNPEKVAATKPDLFIGGGMAEPGFAKLTELKIPVVVNADWLEETPLGRAEWLKFESVFLNREARANAAYDGIVSRYRAAVTKAQGAATKPTVLWGKQYKGQWYQAGGRSYQAAFLRDAGAAYVFADTTHTSSKPVDLEVVLAAGADAEFWLNVQENPQYPTVAALVASEPRYNRLAAVRNGNIWNPSRSLRSNGGNDYWERGLAHPDEVLVDMVALFHPELDPAHQFVYYEKLPA